MKLKENTSLLGVIGTSELQIDSLYSLRPAFDVSDYSTPIDGLFICGGYPSRWKPFWFVRFKRGKKDFARE